MDWTKSNNFSVIHLHASITVTPLWGRNSSDSTPRLPNVFERVTCSLLNHLVELTWQGRSEKWLLKSWHLTELVLSYFVLEDTFTRCPLWKACSESAFVTLCICFHSSEPSVTATGHQRENRCNIVEVHAAKSKENLTVGGGFSVPLLPSNAPYGVSGPQLGILCSGRKPKITVKFGLAVCDWMSLPRNMQIV